MSQVGGFGVGFAGETARDIGQDSVPRWAVWPGLEVGEWVFWSARGGFDPVSNSIVTRNFEEQSDQIAKTSRTRKSSAAR